MASTAEAAGHTQAGRTGAPLTLGPPTYKPRSPRARIANLVSSVNLWDGIPFFLVAILLIIIFSLEPLTHSYTGLSLLLAQSVPLALAALAQMFVMTAADIDLGIGSFVGLTNTVTVVVLMSHWALGILVFLAMIGAYVAMGLLIHYRRLPALVVTLGASFIWLGLALTVLPTPGGTVPSYIITLFTFSPKFVPGPIVLFVLMALVGNVILIRSRYGSVLRGIGSNPSAVERAGWSVAAGKATLYGLAGLFGILAGLALSANTTSGDPNNGASYVLLSIAAVIIGGGEFTGGRVAPAGAVAGAVVLGLITSLLVFLQVSSNYQVGVEGLILILVIAVKAVRARRQGTW